MKRILPILLVSVFALAAGAGAGAFLKPVPVPDENGAQDPADNGEVDSAKQGDIDNSEVHKSDDAKEEMEPTAQHTGDDAQDGEDKAIDYVKIERQFIVPVVEEGQISSLVLMSVALEVKEGGSEVVFEKEPKLRDAFLQVFFAHAQSGGFDGSFTRESRLADLRTSLMKAARKVLGEIAQGVLLTNILRQDV